MNPPRRSNSSRSSQDKEAAAPSLDYDHLLRLALRYWKWLVGGLVLGFVGGYLYAASQTAIYEATSTLLVKDKDAELPHIGEDQSYSQSPDLLKTFEQLLQTKDLAERVVTANKLNENPEFLGKGFTPPVSVDAATSMLASDVAIRIRGMTRLIDITVDHPSPTMAKFLADQLAQQAVLQQLDQGGARAGTLSEYLGKEVARLQQKVADSEKALNDYQGAHPEGVSLQADTDVTGARYKDLNQQYMNAQAQVMLLSERYGPQHPKLIQAEKVADELRDEVNKAQNDTVKEGGTSIGYEALKMEAESYKLQLGNMLHDLNGVQGAAHVGDAGISVTGSADLPMAPVRPSKTKSAAVGAFLGLICGVGFIFALYFIDGTIRTVTQAEATLALPVIAAIPILSETEGKSVLPTYSDPQSFVAESFRGLRASLLLHDRENPIKTILVVSAIPGEGKSFCAANLAVAFAQAGLKTLLIDADLRLPTLHTYFNVPEDKGKGGFANVLTGTQKLDSAVLKSPIPTLDLLLTITPAESPAEMLSTIRLPLLLDEVASKYDRVVVDSAPLNAVSDTMLIMPKADAILLVVRASSTPASESKAALQKVSSSKMKPLGLILNYLAPHTLKSYAYGYSYGQKPKEKYAK